jgi:hypothetical protein
MLLQAGLAPPRRADTISPLNLRVGGSDSSTVKLQNPVARQARFPRQVRRGRPAVIVFPSFSTLPMAANFARSFELSTFPANGVSGNLPA